jgi:SAM-dependent methyltransferase
MDFLHPLSPIYEDKQIEQQLYLAHWDPLIGPPGRALDLGGGIGRWAQWLLSRGWEVELVDPDLRSLWRALHWAGEHPTGRFYLHWSTAESLPALAPVDLIVACEVLCYCEDPAQVVANMLRVLRPGGRLLLSVEARWGWAMAPDAAPGSVDCLFGDGVVHVPGDRWVRTYQRAELEALLAPFADVEIIPGHYAWSGPFETAAGPRSPEAAIALEARLRQHPVAAPLNRTWMASALRPTDRGAQVH